jgi:hypothetical protein
MKRRYFDHYVLLVLWAISFLLLVDVVLNTMDLFGVSL